MRQQIISAVVLLLLVAGAATLVQDVIKKNSSSTFQAQEEVATKIAVKVGNQTFLSDVAKTEEEKAQGLSGRKSLARDGGMLFIFSSASKPSFWMRDMLFPLDFIWITDDLHVSEITPNVPAPKPGTSLNQLPLYQPQDNIRYVLEVNAGAASKIHIGDSVSIGESSVL